MPTIHRRVSLLLIACMSMSVAACTIWEKPAPGWKGATGGEQLERQLWKEIADGNWTELQRRMASSFTLTNSKGSFNREQAIEQWKQMELEDYSLGDFDVKSNGPDMVVSYVFVRKGKDNNQKAEPLRAMSVWQESKTGWVLIAHSITAAKS